MLQSRFRYVRHGHGQGSGGEREGGGGVVFRRLLTVRTSVGSLVQTSRQHIQYCTIKINSSVTRHAGA
jgi:hypothetical protein